MKNLARSVIACVVALPCLCSAKVYWDTSPNTKGVGYELIGGQGTAYLQYRFFLPYLSKSSGGADQTVSYPHFPGGLNGEPSLVFTLNSDSPGTDANMAYDIQVWGFYQGDTKLDGSDAVVHTNVQATVDWYRQGEHEDFSGDLKDVTHPHDISGSTDGQTHFKEILPTARHQSNLSTGYFRLGDQVTLTPSFTESLGGSNAAGYLDMGGANAWDGLYLSIQAIPVALPVPEPSSALLALFGLAALIGWRTRR